VAAITGASSGIGAGFAEALAVRGMDLILIARRGERLEALARRLGERHGVRASALVADLSDRVALGRVSDALRTESRLGLLVNCAGYGKGGAFADADPGRLENEIYLNLISVALLTRAALPGMIARGSGSVINVASTGGFNPSPNFAAYSAAKSGVILLTQALSHELRGTGVSVQTLCPGPVPTEFNRVALGSDAMPVPGFLVQSVEDCVAASLRALDRATVTCMPHLASAVLTRTLQRLPLSWRLKILGGATAPAARSAA
jgi:hypothetical protein